MNLNKIGKKKAITHLIFIPIILALCTFFLNKELALIVPIEYIFFITILQFIRLKTTTKRHLKVYSIHFFRTLEKMLEILFLIIVIILVGVVA